MLLNNIKFAESQGAKNWTTRAKKFIQNFKGSKEELVYQVAERYGNKVGQYSSDFNLKNAGGMVKESERLTKSGKIRQRYRKRAAAPDVKYIDKSLTDIEGGGYHHIFWYIVNAASEHNIVYTSIAAKEEANDFLENIALIIKEETFNL